MPIAPSAVPFLNTIGARILHSGKGGTTIVCPLSDRVKNYAGTMHGGVIAAIAEAAAHACLTQKHPRGKHRTVEMKMNYFRPIAEGSVTAVAKLVDGEEAISVLSVDIFGRDKSLAAAAIVTLIRG